MEGAGLARRAGGRADPRPQGDLSTVDALAQAQIIDALAFNPWNTTDEFRPLGNLNRARKAVYDASVGAPARLPLADRSRRCGTWSSAAAARAVFALVNRYVPWHRLPVRLGLLNLDAFRYVLRAQNLFDTELREAPPQAAAGAARPARRAASGSRRTFDGTHNDLSAPEMGAVGAAFGRNLRPDFRPELFDEPNPITVSQQLLHREQFLPARSLNLLAAAWIQFQVHDWVSHAALPARPGRRPGAAAARA